MDGLYTTLRRRDHTDKGEPKRGRDIPFTRERPPFAAGAAPLARAQAGAGARSYRSRFMTLSHAATKSRTNFSRASSLA